MLKAHQHKKLGAVVARLLPEGVPWDGERWRELVAGSEDALTASVFERLAYLAPARLWGVLREAVVPLSSVPFPIAPPDSPVWEFWPSWSLTSGTPAPRRVEPDVVMRDGTARIMVFEAKLGGMQDAQQWIHEVCAARNEFPSSAVTLVAVGGLDPAQHPVLAAEAQRRLAALGVPAEGFYCLPWASLARALRELGATAPLHPGERQLVEALCIVLAPHSRTPQPMATLPSVRVNETVLRNWHPAVHRSMRGGLAGLEPVPIETPAKTLLRWRPR